MTKKEFSDVCSLQQTGSSVTIEYEKFNMTGKLIGCWKDYLVIDIDNQQTLWPSDLCEVKPRTYDTPSYS